MSKELDKSGITKGIPIGELEEELAQEDDTNTAA